MVLSGSSQPSSSSSALQATSPAIFTIGRNHNTSSNLNLFATESFSSILLALACLYSSTLYWNSWNAILYDFLTYLCFYSAHLSLRLLIRLLHISVRAVHYPCFMASLVADDLRHDQLQCLPDPEHNGVPVNFVKEIPGDIWHNRCSSNLPFPDIQTSLFRLDIPGRSRRSMIVQ